mgnify:CR=1 FL=1
MEKFTKKDLRTGDIVELRNGNVGFVFAEKDAIIYDKTGGYDTISYAFNDDFKDELDDDENFDIVRIYRADRDDELISFLDFRNNGHLVFKADDAPEIKKTEITPMPNIPKKEVPMVLAMGYYGNKTMTDASVDEIISGFCASFIKEHGIKVNKEYIKLPDSECYVVYDPTKEKKPNEKLVCEISEYDIKIYSRCVFCRLDENGNTKSLLDEDFEIINKYIK